MKTKIPQLPTSPFAPVELLDKDDLNAADRKILADNEAIIEAGRKTFFDVGTALQKIRDYKHGILYKCYGTFDEYCTHRWEFGRSYAHRLMEATEIYEAMLPMGNKSRVKLLPSSERQIRPLIALPSPKKRWAAWEATVIAAGENPIRGRDVEKEVRAIIKSEGLVKPTPRKKRKAKQKSYHIAAEDLMTIQAKLKLLRSKLATVKGKLGIALLIDEIEALLPGQ